MPATRRPRRLRSDHRRLAGCTCLAAALQPDGSKVPAVKCLGLGQVRGCSRYLRPAADALPYATAPAYLELGIGVCCSARSPRTLIDTCARSVLLYERIRTSTQHDTKTINGAMLQQLTQTS